MSTTPRFEMPEWDGRPREAGEVWRLRKGSWKAECTLWTHPIGAEVRVSVEGELLRCQAGRDRVALIDLGRVWNRRFVQKGWTR